MFRDSFLPNALNVSKCVFWWTICCDLLVHILGLRSLLLTEQNCNPISILSCSKAGILINGNVIYIGIQQPDFASHPWIQMDWLQAITRPYRSWNSGIGSKTTGVSCWSSPASRLTKTSVIFSQYAGTTKWSAAVFLLIIGVEPTFMQGIWTPINIRARSSYSKWASPMLKRSCPNIPSSSMFATIISALNWMPSRVMVNFAVPSCNRG